ncbi:uncharacterized protein [Aegilops tauschii subsp. strangulata]|uniref:uncharacterized protein n=1 Tax=Aegilops tauschii subsp. strangulata TaxID=200361 RepID=UPI003CC8B956
MWRNLFAFTVVSHITSPCSDHIMLLLKASADPGPTGAKPRRYELFWETDGTLPEVIKEAWDAVGGVCNLAQLRDALSKTMISLGTWGRKFGNVTRELAKSRTQLEELMHMNADQHDIRRVTDKMNELLYQEEMIWLQRSRISWLKEGDRNTKFFQNKAVWRAQKNKIRQLTDSGCVVHSEFAAMSEIANNYFHEIFSADATLVAASVLDLLEPMVTEEDNAELCAAFSDKEIANAMFQIGPLKAPGPDGFPARFFQRNWSTVRDDVIAAVKDFFVTGIMPEGSAFVPGRMITDNALVAFEWTIQEQVRDVLGVTSTVFEEQYLGLPTPEGRMSKGKFQNLQTSLTKRLIQWGDGLLAQPGREVLIKAIAQALPTYTNGKELLLRF